MNLKLIFTISILILIIFYLRNMKILKFIKNHKFKICLLIIITIIVIYYNRNKITKQVIGIAHLNNNNIKGNILFKEDNINNNVKIEVNLSGLPSNSELGFHIHEAGDLSEGCKSACMHFNPFNEIHGGPESVHRHVGDLGNIKTDQYGNCSMSFADSMIKLNDNNKSIFDYLFNTYTSQNIIGRSIVIHDKIDDLGLGNNSESLKTGNAGSRIACAVIGYSKEMCK